MDDDILLQCRFFKSINKACQLLTDFINISTFLLGL